MNSVANKYRSIFGDAVLALAPMAGYSTAPFRRICYDEGADFAYTEMVSADGLIRGGEKTFEYMRMMEGERFTGVQLFGSDPAVMAEAARIAAQNGAAFIDMNFGCPVKKVIRRNGGASLMRDLDLMGRIAAAVVETVEIPVTAKIRSGWTAKDENYVEAGLVLEGAGVDAVVIHPRYRTQGFSGRSNWEHIARLREALTIEVIGNGDVTDVEDFIELRRVTGCRIVMIGRGALGRPWLFRRIKDSLAIEAGVDVGPEVVVEGGIGETVSIADFMLRHFELTVSWDGERRAVSEMRKQFKWYLRGVPGAKEYRLKLMSAADADMVRSILRSLKEELVKRWRKLA
ncbi:MAG: tRNA dihydrouridine synthase DusB [Candidatus Latescibacteria bacterium 4484_7]|nr:MAG: tRNA dihydrouridine synthase DusB [Candidatus Latescibacteria bacterium 4484_7]